MWARGSKRWMWRAWTEKRERIADCGWVTADTAADAKSNAQATLGGPYRSAVVEITVEEIP